MRGSKAEVTGVRLVVDNGWRVRREDNRLGDIKDTVKRLVGYVKGKIRGFKKS